MTHATRDSRAGVTCSDVFNVVGTKFTCDVKGAGDFSKVRGRVAQGDKVNFDSFE